MDLLLLLGYGHYPSLQEESCAIQTEAHVFSFPSEYAAICCQYLQWFGEFLKDVGIHGLVSTHNQEGKTFFTVTPNAEQTAVMERIEQALHLYLTLPYCEIHPLENTELTIEQKMAFQLTINQIENYKQQIQLKDAIIECKSVTINSIQEQLQESKSRLLLLESIEPKVESPEFLGISLEEHKWGILKITPSKWIKHFKSKSKNKK